MLITTFNDNYDALGEIGGKRRKYICEDTEIEKRVNLYDLKIYEITGIDVAKIDLEKLNEAVKKEDISGDYDNLEAFLKSQGYENFNCNVVEYPLLNHCLMYDTNENDFFDLNDCDYEYAYTYHDGNNWKTISCDDIEEVDLGNHVLLDEWNGHNWECGGLGLHVWVYKVVSIDKVPCEGKYLLYESSQWQGSIDCGTVFTVDEIKVALDELDRSEYIEKIKKL
jgi:hypothetical protein